MSKAKDETKKSVNIDGAILSDEAISQIVKLQNESNYWLNLHLETLADAVCILSIASEVVNDAETKTEIQDLQIDISHLRNDLKNLRV